jgi:hypothetical protein
MMTYKVAVYTSNRHLYHVTQQFIIFVSNNVMILEGKALSSILNLKNNVLSL